MKKVTIKTICYFGLYQGDYSRSRILLKGFRENDIKVLECSTTKKGISKYSDLVWKHWSMRHSYDALVVAFPGYQAAILARLLTRRPIIFDAFTSLHNSMVEDRKLVKPGSPRALYLWLLDWLACHLSDYILLDTSAHIELFVQKFGLGRQKFCRVFVGADEETLPPRQEGERPEFIVHFHGSFIPLQGIEYIIKAAKILEQEPFRFVIIGAGQTSAEIKKMANDLAIKNIEFIDTVPFAELATAMNRASIALGIFGDTEKARRVIPNKVYEAMASGLPIITARTPAALELLQDHETVLFCNLADAADLALKIKELYANQTLRETIAANARRLFLKRLTPRILVASLLACVGEYN